MSYTGKISIVIPCYNHGLMLRETLASIERVRNENICEVIIVNDGSTDEQTCQILRNLSDLKYKIINQSNRGLGAARNAGIEKAQAEFILPLDSDNLVRKAYLSDGVKVLLANSAAGVVYADAEYFGEKTGRWKAPEFNLGVLVMGNYIDACALYRKSVWESAGGYDEKMPWMGWEDWDFWLRVGVRGWDFIHLDQVGFDYRVRVGSMLTETDLHRKELVKYIFKKRENKALAIIRKQNHEIEKLGKIETSNTYRLARRITGPMAYVHRIFAGGKRSGDQIERIQDIEI